LTVRLRGLTTLGLPNEHHVSVRINGHDAGAVEWEGAEPKELVADLPADVIRHGDNIVEVTGLLNDGVAYSLVLVNEIEVGFDHLYRAEDDYLLCRAPGRKTVTVHGLGTGDVAVFDLSDPARPRRITKVRIDGADGAYTVRFKAKKSSIPYAVAGLASMLTPDLKGATDGTLARRDDGADYLVIAPPALAAAAGNIAEYRASQGLSTRVVTTADIYASFNDGIAGPHAIHDFLAYVARKWKNVPDYVLLAGHGDYDYKDFKGLGQNLIPPLMVPTPKGLFAADSLYAYAGSRRGAPTCAVGRLPALSPAELFAMLAKIQAYESSTDQEWYRAVALVADNPDDGGNFTASAEALAGLTPQEPGRIYLADLPVAEAREQFLASVGGGASTVAYYGHAAMDRVAGEYLLKPSDIPGLLNADRPSVMLALSCLLGRFELPGVDALGEQLVAHPNGGTVAVWAPSGMSLNALANKLGQGVFRARYAGGTTSLGAAIRQSLEQYRVETGDSNPTLYNLIGDPALALNGAGVPAPLTSRHPSATGKGEAEGYALEWKSSAAGGDSLAAGEPGSTFSATFQRPKTDKAVTYIVEWSTDLVTWQPDPALVQEFIVDDGNDATETVRVQVQPTISTNNLFFRLLIGQR
jgi:hypothetical protein